MSNVLSTDVWIDNQMHGPIESHRDQGPPPETDEAWKTRHFGAVLTYANGTGGTITRLKTRWLSSGTVHADSSDRKGAWSNEQTVSAQSSKVGNAWTEYPPDA